LDWPSLLSDGVTGAASRISGSEEDDEDAGAQTVHPPCDGTWLSSAKQIAIAAPHTTHGVPDQAGNLRATRRCQPLAARLAAHVGIEQHGGYLTVARVRLPSVQRAQHQDQPSPLLSGEWRDGRRRRSGQVLPELYCGFDALRQKCVKRNNSRERRSRRSLSKHPKLTIAAMLAQQDMAPVRPVDAKCGRWQPAECQ
jgi:hypothetical protein